MTERDFKSVDALLGNVSTLLNSSKGKECCIMLGLEYDFEKEEYIRDEIRGVHFDGYPCIFLKVRLPHIHRLIISDEGERDLSSGKDPNSTGLDILIEDEDGDYYSFRDRITFDSLLDVLNELYESIQKECTNEIDPKTIYLS